MLYELDGKPALALYKDYLGDLAAGLPATALLFPLAIRPHDDSAGLLVRTVLARRRDDAVDDLRRATSRRASARG